MSTCLICGRKLGTFDERECYNGGCASHKRKDGVSKTFDDAAEQLCEQLSTQLDAGILEEVVSLFNSGVLKLATSTLKPNFDKTNCNLSIEQCFRVSFEGKARVIELEALLQESCLYHQDAILAVDKGVKALLSARDRIKELEAQIARMKNCENCNATEVTCFYIGQNPANCKDWQEGR